MATLSLTPGIWSRLGDLFGEATRQTARRPPSKPSTSDFRAGREFIMDMVWSNPEALSSEQDVETLMMIYPGRF